MAAFIYNTDSPLQVGEIVSHEDYTSELFTVTEIDGEKVETSGGKNGTWVNDIELIIRNPVKWEPIPNVRLFGVRHEYYFYTAAPIFSGGKVTGLKIISKS